jgi:hypothetical protein
MKSKWRAPCEPARMNDGVPYCRTHGDYRNTCGFPRGLVGWELPPAGWRCAYSEERWGIYDEGYRAGQNIAMSEQRGEFPEGRCPSIDCTYPEPHRHGFDCDATCACEGIGPETVPLESVTANCGWGDCGRDTVAMRYTRTTRLKVYVCSWHAGWDDTWLEGEEGERG